MDNSEAYRILTRLLTNMHHTERNDLDVSPQYQEIMDAVKAGDVNLARYLAQGIRNSAGDAYRARRGLPFLVDLSN